MWGNPFKQRIQLSLSKCCILGINILSHAILDQGDDKAAAPLNDKSEYYLLIYYSRIGSFRILYFNS